MEPEPRKIAADAVECAPEIGGFAVRVMQHYSGGVYLLRKANAAPEAQAFALRPCGNPLERKVGYKVVVVVEPADVTVAAWEEHFHDLTLVAIKRNVLEELSRLVTGDGMPRPSHIAWTIHRDIEP